MPASCLKNARSPSVVVAQPLPRDGDMLEDHIVPEDGSFPGPGLEVVERQRVAKERVA